MIRGGCDLFTTKPIGADRKLFKTIDRHLDQILEDQQLSESHDRDRKSSVSSFIGKSCSPGQLLKGSLHLDSSLKDSVSLHFNNELQSLYRNSPTDNSFDGMVDGLPLIEDSPFGSLKQALTRKTFAYLIAILNTTYPDHDFSSLQPSTENFHKIDSIETLVNQFNNIMVSLGKKDDLLSWIWDTINAYMDILPPRSPSQGGSSRRNSLNIGGVSVSPSSEAFVSVDPGIKIYEFRPTDQSISEDLYHPHRIMWSNYWFIHNKKKKRVCFLYLTGINRVHYGQLNVASQFGAKSFEDEQDNDKYEISSSNEATADEDIMGGMEL